MFNPPRGAQVSPLILEKMEALKNIRKITSPDRRFIIGEEADFINTMSKQRFSSMVQNKLKSMLKHNQAFYFQNKQTNQVLTKPQSLKQIVANMIDDKMQLVFQDDNKSKAN